MDANKVMGRKCKQGHSGLRYKSSHACVECQRLRCLRPKEKARMLVANKRRYIEIRESILLKQKNYRKTPRGRALQMLQAVAARSRKKGFQTNITLDWLVKKLTDGICEITGLPFNFSSDGLKGPYAPSLDRIDATKGYTTDNCRVVLWALNTAFSWWGATTFEPIARAWLDTCMDCGAVHDRDVNAARNILTFGSRCRTSVRGNESSDSLVPLSAALKTALRETGTETARMAA